MATESVTTLGVVNKRVPGLDDLLVPVSNNPETASNQARAAANALEPINQGIRAIGELLWRTTGESKFELDDRTVHGLGVLLIHLADFSEHVGFIEHNARFTASEQELLQAQAKMPATAAR